MSTQTALNPNLTPGALINKRIHTFHMTGFGKFAGIDLNPAKFTVEVFQDEITSRLGQSDQNTSNYVDLFRTMILPHLGQNNQSDDDTQKLIQQLTDELEVYINTNILQVDVETVEEYFALKYQEIKDINDQIYQRYAQPNQDKSVSITIYHHFIHVGVHGGATGIYMEEYAYNNATFGCDDEAQYRPFQIPIRCYNPKTNQIECKVLEKVPIDQSKSIIPSYSEENGNCDGFPGETRNITTTFSPPPPPPPPQPICSKWFIPPQPVTDPNGLYPTVPGDDNTTCHEKYQNTQIEHDGLSTQYIPTTFVPPSDIIFDSVLQTQLDLNTVHPQLIKIHRQLTTLQKQNDQLQNTTIANNSGGELRNKNQKFHDPTNPNKTEIVQAPITITSDPGGFLCNYIFYCSLYNTRFIFPHINNRTDFTQCKVQFSSLFYHIPMLNVSSIKNNVNILLSTIASILLIDLQSVLSQSVHSDLGVKMEKEVVGGDEQQSLPLTNSNTAHTFQSTSHLKPRHDQEIHHHHHRNVLTVQYKSNHLQPHHQSPPDDTHHHHRTIEISKSITPTPSTTPALLKYITIQGGRLPRRSTMKKARDHHHDSNNQPSKEAIIAQLGKDIAVFLTPVDKDDISKQ